MLELRRMWGLAGALLMSPMSLLTVVGSLAEDADRRDFAGCAGVVHRREVARILGHEQYASSRCMTGDKSHGVRSGVHDAILVLTVKGEAQLGLLRHRAREAAERIAGLCSARMS